jgi:hypothetical protein
MESLPVTTPEARYIGTYALPSGNCAHVWFMEMRPGDIAWTRFQWSVPPEEGWSPEDTQYHEHVLLPEIARAIALMLSHT